MGALKLSQISPTGNERYLAKDKIIVSKTDPKGIITYVNDVFMNISGYSEREMLGKPHSIIRHPDMPRAAFKLLWDTISSGNEMFAYVINMAKNGDHYWVFAHVTPSYTMDGKLYGYHSSRRAPKQSALEVIKPIYRQLLDIERNVGGTAGVDAAIAALVDILKTNKISYEEFIFSISNIGDSDA